MANSDKWKKIEVETSSGKIDVTNYVNSVNIKIADAETSTEFVTKPYSPKRVADIEINGKVYLFEFNDDDMSVSPVYSAGNIIIPPQLEVRNIDGNKRIITGVKKGK